MSNIHQNGPKILGVKFKQQSLNLNESTPNHYVFEILFDQCDLDP